MNFNLRLWIFNSHKNKSILFGVLNPLDFNFLGLHLARGVNLEFDFSWE